MCSSEVMWLSSIIRRVHHCSLCVYAAAASSGWAGKGGTPPCTTVMKGFALPSTSVSTQHSYLDTLSKNKTIILLIYSHSCFQGPIIVSLICFIPRNTVLPRKTLIYQGCVQTATQNLIFSPYRFKTGWLSFIVQIVTNLRKFYFCKIH